MAKASTAVAERNGTTIMRDRMATAISEMARPEQSPEEMALAIINATTLEGILGSTVLHMEDYVGTPFLVVGANLNPSEFTDGLGAYAVLDTILSDGSRAVITSGATNVVAQLVAMHAGDFFPAWVEFKSDTTKKGFTVYKLIKGSGEAPTAQQLKAWGESF